MCVYLKVLNMSYDPSIHTIILKRKSYGNTIVTYYMKTSLYNLLSNQPIDNLLIYCGSYIRASYHDC